METILELLPLLAVAAYYLLRGRQRANSKRVPQEMQEARGDGQRAPTPFESFMQQMEEALAEAAGEPERQPEPKPEPIKVEVDRSVSTPSLPAPPVGPPVRTPEFQPAAGSFSGRSPVDHERHGFGLDSPLSEERFERGRRAAPDAARRGYEHDGLRQTPAPRGGRGGWSARLRDPQAARDAFVLQTIFGPRGGRHPAPSGTPERP